MRHSGEEGFTLIESLVAFAILAVVVVTGLSAVSGSFQRLTRADEKTAAVDLAERQLKLLARSAAVRDGSDSGFEGRLFWQAEVREVSGAGWGQINAFRLRVTVRANRKDGPELTSLSSVVLSK